MVIEAGTLRTKTEIDLTGYRRGLVDMARAAERQGRQGGQRFSRSFSQGTRRTGQEAGNEISRGLIGTLEQNLRSIRGGFFGRIGGEIANATVVGFARAFRRGIGDAFNDLRNVDELQARLFTLGVDDREVAERFTDLNAALGTQISRAETLQVAYSLLSAGISDVTAQTDAFNAVVDLSVGGFADTDQAVRVLTRTVANFGGTYQDAADIVSAAVIRGQFDVQQFAGQFPRLAQLASQAGFSLEETAALVSQISQETGTASQAITEAVNFVANAVLDPSQQTREIFRELGVDVRALVAEGGLPALVDLLGQLNEEQISGIFGQRGVAGAGALLKNVELLTDNLEFFNNATGLASRNQERAQQTLNQLFGTFGNLVGDARAELAEELTPVFRGIVGLASEAVEGMRDFFDAVTDSENPAEALERFLDRHQDLARQLGENFASFVSDGLEAATGVAQELLGYLEENPDVIKNATAAMGDFVSAIGSAINGASRLVGILQTAASVFGSLGGLSGVQRRLGDVSVRGSSTGTGGSIASDLIRGIGGLFGLETSVASPAAAGRPVNPLLEGRNTFDRLRSGLSGFGAASIPSTGDPVLDAQIAAEAAAAGGGGGGSGGGGGRSGRSATERAAEQQARANARALERVQIESRRLDVAEQILAAEESGNELAIAEARTAQELLGIQLDRERAIEGVTDEQAISIANQNAERETAIALRELEIERAELARESAEEAERAAKAQAQIFRDNAALLGVYGTDLQEVNRGLTEGEDNTNDLTGAISQFGSALAQAFDDEPIARYIQLAVQLVETLLPLFQGGGSSPSKAFTGPSGIIGGLLGAFGGIGGGIKGGGVGGALGGFLGAGNTATGLLGFQTGGSFTIGGSGGPDSQVVAFRGTPGEMVNVQRPGQQEGQIVHVHNWNISAIDSRDFDQRLRQHQGTIERIVGDASRRSTRYRGDLTGRR